MKSRDLDVETQRALYDVAVLLYQAKAGGASAVYDLARLLGWEEWRRCQDCDAETPELAGDCMVCGQRYT